MNGLHNKYRVLKASGATDSKAVYFVLRIDTDPHAREAALTYAAHVAKDNTQLSQDLVELVNKYE